MGKDSVTSQKQVKRLLGCIFPRFLVNCGCILEVVPKLNFADTSDSVQRVLLGESKFFRISGDSYRLQSGNTDSVLRSPEPNVGNRVFPFCLLVCHGYRVEIYWKGGESKKKARLKNEQSRLYSIC